MYDIGLTGSSVQKVGTALDLVRIVIASSYVPFIRGGGTMIVDSLEAALSARGHRVATVKIPLWSYWPTIAAQTVAIRCLDLTESAGDPVDRLITIRYPSYALRHPNKVAWFIHHHRGAYDLWGTPYQDIPDTEEGRRVRAMMIASDTLYLREARKVFTNSQIVADRLRLFNGIEADGVLYPPLPDPTLFREEPSEDYFIYSSRMTPIKRQLVAIEAMRRVRSPLRLLLVGAADVEDHLQALRRTIEENGLADRVSLLGWVSEEEKARLTARALAALYIAFDEDSYGYSTLEAFHSRKPVITFQDSGGTLEVVRHGVNGLILAPTPEALAEGMECLWANRRRAAEMGHRGYETVRQMGICWDEVVERITA